MQKKYTYFSTFSGIGAFEKGFDKISQPYELYGYCEIDKYASKAYSLIHNTTECMNYGDITKIDETKIEKDLDFFTYGFPCQDISLAGNQKGLVDERGNKTRSGLVWDATRIIKASQPKIAIAENVKNLVSKKFKKEFEAILAELDEAGYNNYWKVLNAKEHGIAQNRKRVFIVSIRKDIDTGLFEWPETEKLTTRLIDYLEHEVDEKYYISYKQEKRLQESTYQTVVKTKRGNDVDGVEYVKERFFKQALETVETNKVEYGDTINAFNKTVNKSGLCPTITTRPEGFKTAIVLVTKDLRIRKLTPKECWRFMGFDDKDHDIVERLGISNSQRYKMAGNSIVVNVIAKILKNLIETVLGG